MQNFVCTWEYNSFEVLKLYFQIVWKLLSFEQYNHMFSKRLRCPQFVYGFISHVYKWVNLPNLNNFRGNCMIINSEFSTVIFCLHLKINEVAKLLHSDSFWHLLDWFQEQHHSHTQCYHQQINFWIYRVDKLFHQSLPLHFSIRIHLFHLEAFRVVHIFFVVLFGLVHIPSPKDFNTWSWYHKPKPNLYDCPPICFLKQLHIPT